jgi:hypothetical protein
MVMPENMKKALKVANEVAAASQAGTSAAPNIFIFTEPSRGRGQGSKGRPWGTSQWIQRSRT